MEVEHQVEAHCEGVDDKIYWTLENDDISIDSLPEVYLKLRVQEKHQWVARFRGRATEIFPIEDYPPNDEVFSINFLEFLLCNALQDCARDVLVSTKLLPGDSCGCLEEVVAGMRNTTAELAKRMAAHVAKGRVIETIVVTVDILVLKSHYYEIEHDVVNGEQNVQKAIAVDDREDGGEDEADDAEEAVARFESLAVNA